MKNRLIKTFFKFYRPRLLETDHPERILIISTTGLGDTLWATPAIRAIKKRWPKAFIGILTTSLGSALLKNNPYIDTCLAVDDPVLKSLPRLYRQLKELQFDTCLIFHVSQRPLIPLVKMVGPSRLIGSAGISKGLDNLLTQIVPAQFEHEIQRRLRIASQIDVPIGDFDMELFIDEPFPLPSHRPLIGLHPGSKDGFKRWRPENFVALGRALDGDVVVTGTQEERPLGQAIADQIPFARNLAGQLSLGQMAYLLRHMALFITNDTGPMHMALAQKTPTLALFGPTNHKLCGPLNISDNEIIQVSPCCSPCLKKKCKEPFCLDQIDLLSVIAKAQTMLRSKRECSLP